MRRTSAGSDAIERACTGIDAQGRVAVLRFLRYAIAEFGKELG